MVKIEIIEETAEMARESMLELLGLGLRPVPVSEREAVRRGEAERAGVAGRPVTGDKP